MAKNPPKTERSPRRGKEPRVPMTTAGLHALIHFVDRLGQPDEIGPSNLVFAWFEAGAILIVMPDHEQCTLRDDHDDTFFELFGWCVYHHIEVDLLAPEDFEEGFNFGENSDDRTEAVTFTELSPDDVAAFQEVVRGRGGVCMSDHEFHGKGGADGHPDAWPDTGILVVYQPAGDGSAAQGSGGNLLPRNATLYAHNSEWLRTTVVALRTLVGSHDLDGRKVQ